jgi:hypothetical protein
MMTGHDADDSMLGAIAPYMLAVNKLMAWCERVRPALNSSAYGEWAGSRDAILREIADKREALADICRKEDAGINNNIWVRMAHGEFDGPIQ